NKKKKKKKKGVSTHTHTWKPFLARTSSTFYHEPGKYFAADIDSHLFGFPARKGLSYIKDLIDNMVYDIGFVIEGHSDDELPERILCCARISRIGIKQASSFPLELVEIASDKGHSKSYNDLHISHIMKKIALSQVAEQKQKEEAEAEAEAEEEDLQYENALQRIEAQDRFEKADISMFSDTNDEEAQKILQQISLEEQTIKKCDVAAVGLATTTTPSSTTTTTTTTTDVDVQTQTVNASCKQADNTRRCDKNRDSNDPLTL
ncbi:hypothetical protein RFI_20039, partial [Reticulomyxa filosa]